MKLARKGQSTKIARKKPSSKGPAFSRLEVSLAWSGIDADLDLAVMFKPKGSSEIGLCWGLDVGSLSEFPFMLHSGDEAGDDAEETVVIQDPSAIEKAWIFVWEYGDDETGQGGMLEGVPARFDEGEISVIIEDDLGNETEVSLETVGAGANCCCIAILDCSGDEIELSNQSSAGLIHDLAETEQLLDVVNGRTPKHGSAYD